MKTILRLAAAAFLLAAVSRPALVSATCDPAEAAQQAGAAYVAWYTACNSGCATHPSVGSQCYGDTSGTGFVWDSEGCFVGLDPMNCVCRDTGYMGWGENSC
jgi:hypothetical protein